METTTASQTIPVPPPMGIHGSHEIRETFEYLTLYRGGVCINAFGPTIPHTTLVANVSKESMSWEWTDERLTLNATTEQGERLTIILTIKK